MDGGTGTDRLAALRARVARAKAAAEVDLLTPEDREEQGLRAQAAEHEAERRSREREQRAIDLERRIDAARERLAEASGQDPDKILLEGLDLEDDSPGAGTYVIQAIPTRAHERWKKTIAKPDADTSAAERDAALASVVDWNGQALTKDSTFAPAIRSAWDRYPLAPLSIVNVAHRLGGFRQEQRKS